jgi:hypothetical protein
MTQPTAQTAPFSMEEFLALGGEHKIVYRRHLTGRELKQMFPEASLAPERAEFEALFGADGTPLLIADNQNAVLEWLAETGHHMAVRH